MGFAARGIFLDQGSNPGLLHWQADSVQLSHQGSPKILLRKFYRQGTDWNFCKTHIQQRIYTENLQLSSKIDWRRQWHPTPLLLPGKSYGRRSLVGCSPWGCWELDTTERLHFHALEKEMATHSSVPAWRIPGTGEPGGLPSMGSHRVGHD